ncbi:MAG TPA: histidine kinase dimerization/phospho-acceptor domain-containing protein, partial [Candidatus Polarisedimenticolia bacterium]|nr:histidine kinase dimerization/phospho-acceptor domain-containing protein [Candidatus Polarisedimenticolia bacterium]
MPTDPSLLDRGASAEPDMDDESLRVLNGDVRLATHLRDLALVSIATAHDIRTPLHTIVLYLELLRNAVAEEASTEQRGRQSRYVEVVASELQRLEAMLDGLLAQMRLGEPAAKRLDLGATVQELLL